MKLAWYQHRLITVLLGLALFGSILWLRWPSFGFDLWSLDEAIHATAARVILHGGTLYTDVIDQRTPLSYYAVAGVFAMFGENNLWAVRFGIAVLVTATAYMLGITASRWRGRSAGIWTSVIYAILASTLFFPGDANAAHTEWFVAFFTASGAAVFLSRRAPLSTLKVGITGCLLGCAFLSKQPALLDISAPAGVLFCLYLSKKLSFRDLWLRLIALGGGWILPLALTAGYFAFNHAWADGLFYSWTYNLEYYASDITLADRVNTLLIPFQHLIRSGPVLLFVWLCGGAILLRGLLQREPTGEESTSLPVWTYLFIWSISSLIGAASGGRAFDHYFIQFLPALALGCGLAMGRITRFIKTDQQQRFWRAGAALLLLGIVYQLGSTAWATRSRTLQHDPSQRVSAYIREHSSPTDKLYVWGFHPDIYLYTNLLPGSRYLYGSFQTGLIPWTNAAPEIDTTATIVPGAMTRLLGDLEASQPRYIVDCSAGPNRYWQKYPLDKFPRLNNYIQQHYRVIEGGQFVPQGFRLFARLSPEDSHQPDKAATLPISVTKQLSIGTLSSSLSPVRVTAPHGASFDMQDGHARYFAHAPSQIAYQVPPDANVLRGGFGFRPGAYATTNPTPTDGAEFSILWRSRTHGETTLLRRLLQPTKKPNDQGVQSFRVSLPKHAEPEELILIITPGPTDNPACDWTFWTDLIFENFPLDPEHTSQ